MNNSQLSAGDTLKPWTGKPLSTPKWAMAGKPEMWMLCDEAEGCRLYEDCAYGRIAITDKDNKILNISFNFVAALNGTVVGLGDYYGYSPPRLFKLMS